MEFLEFKNGHDKPFKDGGCLYSRTFITRTTKGNLKQIRLIMRNIVTNFIHTFEIMAAGILHFISV
jgi:hypothetical protein